MCDIARHLREILMGIFDKTPETQQEIWDHISSCAQCRRELTRLFEMSIDSFVEIIPFNNQEFESWFQKQSA